MISEDRAAKNTLYRDPRYYDHAYRQYRPDVDFYVRLAQECGGPVLELGVGTGRIAMAIADAGIALVGIDRDAKMLARCGERLAKKPRRVRDAIELREGDIRSFDLGRRFPLVIAPFNVFQHLYEDVDLEGTLAACRKHMRREALLALDIITPDLDMLSRDPGRFYKCRPTIHPRDGKRYAYAEAFDYDTARQILTVTMRFTDPADPERVFFSRLTQRQYFPREIDMLLRAGGFEIVSHEGGFDGERLDERSDSQVIVARRRR
jgi:SAM-dependent methyltransferase